MGKLYKKLSYLQHNMVSDREKVMVENFIRLLTFDEPYLQKKLEFYQKGDIKYFIQNSGEDILIDCCNFGILITPKDEVSINT